MLIVASTKTPPGATSDEARTMGVVSGFVTDQKGQTNHSEQQDRIQVLYERMAAFKRLESAFNAVGWAFYPLTDESFLAVHLKWHMSTVCPDLRAATALLKRVGGAA